MPRQFHVVELHQAAKRERQFVGVHHVQHRHVVSLEAQVLQTLKQLAQFGETVGDQEHQAAAAGLLGQVVEQRADAGLVGGTSAFQGVQDRQHVAGLTTYRQLRPPGVVED